MDVTHAGKFACLAALGIIGSALAVLTTANTLGNLGPHAAASWMANLPGVQPSAGATILDDSVANGHGFTHPDRLKLVVMARLTQSALDAREVRTLGFIEEINGARNRAQGLMTVAHGLSRRDPVCELWLIERNVSVKNLSSALEHYDAVMSTTPAVWAQLFPILDEALTERPIQDFVSTSLRQGRAWVRPLIDFALGSGKHVPDVAMAIARAGRPAAVPDWEQLDQSVIQRLSDEHSYPALLHYFSSIPNAPKAIVRGVSFDRDTTSSKYNPLSWTLTQQSEVGAVFTKSSSLSASIAPNTSTAIARKLLILRPGRYRLSGKLSIVERSDHATIHISQKCGSRTIADRSWQVYPSNRPREGRFDLMLENGPSCPVSELAIEASGGDSQTGLSFELADMKLVPTA